MPAINTIPIPKLARLIGTPGAPAIIDIRSEAEFAADPRTIPGSQRRAFPELPNWASEYAKVSAVVVCETGSASSHGAVAWLRQAGAEAEVVEGGFRAWAEAGQPVVAEQVLPPRDAQGRTLWVTRARPKVDRIACPWLIRRFVDPHAMFLFVAAPEVLAVANAMGATPFDVEGEGVQWSHRGELCTFDVMVEAFGLGGLEPLSHLATIVRGADTARLDVAPESAGLLAISLGLSRMYADDLEQLEAGMSVYDALYRWCRDATDETHNWTSHTPAKRREKA